MSPSLLMWWPDGHVSGTIHHGTRMFQVKDMGGGMHAVIEMARKMMPPDHAPASLDLLKKMNMDTDPLCGRAMPACCGRRPSGETGPAAPS